MPAIETLK
jgi:hypothetical protein